MPDISPLDHPLLYRAVKSRSWFRQRSAAFKLRKASPPINPEPETDLSVITSAYCTKLVCDAHQHTCFGELMLETKRVVEDWRVTVNDAIDSNHASILGLPLFGSDDRAIEAAATALSNLVTSEKHRPSE
jgi:hypothetical protein